METFFRGLSAKPPTTDDEPGGQMSFLEHLDELRTRLIRSILFVVIAAMGCWFFSESIYRFLEAPVLRALADARLEQTKKMAASASPQSITTLSSAKDGDVLRYVFSEEKKLGTTVIPAGASVAARYTKDTQGEFGLFTDEPLFAANIVIPKGTRLPVEVNPVPQ